jgi:5-methylcytosine-specific restriction endonuclease McrA
MQIGDVLETHYWGDVEVVEIVSTSRVKVKFLNTGNLKETRIHNLGLGSLEDTVAKMAGASATKKRPSSLGTIPVGTKFNSNFYGEVEVVEFVNSKTICIRFLDTGNLQQTQRNSLELGQIQDIALRSCRTLQKAEDEAHARIARDLAAKAAREANFHRTKAGMLQAKRDKAVALVEAGKLVRELKVREMVGATYQNKLGDKFVVVAPTSGNKTWVVEFEDTNNRYEAKEGFITNGGVYDHESEGYPERLRAYNARVNAQKYEVDRERRIAMASAYQRNNRERTRERNKRNVRKRSCAVGSHTRAEKVSLFASQGGKCNCCGYDLTLGKHIDHIMPIVLGGSDDIGNMQWLCQVCNSIKADRHPDEWAVYSASDEFKTRLSERRK